MTIQQRIELSDSLSTAQALLERACYLMDTLIDSYFGKYDPNRDSFAIESDFKRQSAFAFILRDQLLALSAELPNPDWVDGLPEATT